MEIGGRGKILSVDGQQREALSLFSGRGCFLMWYDSSISLGFRFLYAWSKRKLSKKLDERNRAVRMAKFNASAILGAVQIGMGSLS